MMNTLIIMLVCALFLLLALIPLHRITTATVGKLFGAGLMASVVQVALYVGVSVGLYKFVV